ALLPSNSKLYVSGMADPDALLPATRETLEKLTNAIGYFGLGREHVVQLKVFCQPMSEAAAVRRVIAEFFDQRPPPVVLVEWLSANPAVEIELIATIPPDTPHGRVSASEPDALRPVGFFTPPGTTDSPVFRRVARVNRGRLIYTSGLYGWKATDAAGQVREIFQTLGEIVQAHHSDLEHLVKATYYVADAEADRQLNVIRPEFYHPQRAPAASKARVRSVGPPGKTIMVDMIAVTQ
ncbi:MAG: RidA family protein, partial [Verrucomicrobiales bacterium]|nr:RidA family protein [Verrucomicrobiales bacterium]